MKTEPTPPGQSNQKMRTEPEHRSKEEKETLCANKKFKISRTDKILLSADDLNIYISKTSNKVGAKECYEMHAEEPVRRCCWEGVPSPQSLQLRNRVSRLLCQTSA